jgi:O-acetylhomoserine (thiol)-lyase
MAALHFETLALHAGHTVDEATLSRGVPIYRTTAYLFKNTEHAANLFSLKELGNIYSRLMNPTQDVLEQRVAALEGGAASLALASGTSAIFYTIINICALHLVDPGDPANFEKAITEKTRVLYCETIGNPGLEMTDIEAVSRIAKKHHLPLVVDSTFTPPCLFRPLEHGADIVIHSLTKWMGGHGVALGGIVVDSGTFDWTDPRFSLYNEPDQSYHGLRYAHDLGPLNPVAFALRMRLVPLRNLGACTTPDNCWYFLQGLETLSLRMERHCENAMAVAEFLSDHDRVDWVSYPGLTDADSVANTYLKNGFGGMVAFGVKGGRAAGQQFIEALELFSHLANVGDAKSLAIHPASTTHSQLNEEQLKESGLSEAMIRLSVGIEHIDDILGDLEQALQSVKH